MDISKVWDVLKSGGLEAFLLVVAFLLGKVAWEKDKQTKQYMEKFLEHTHRQTEAMAKLTGAVDTMRSILQILVATRGKGNSDE